jgi:hypothetical protein
MAAKPKGVRPAPEQGQYVRLSSCFSGLVDRQERALGRFTESQDYRDARLATICSESSGITLANWPKLSQSRGSLKNHVRADVSPAVRKALWLLVSEVSDDDSVLFAKAFGEPADDEMEGQPRQVCAMYDWPFELSALPSFHLKPQYDSAYFRVLCAFSYSMPNVTCCPLLPVLVGLYGDCMWLSCDVYIMSAVERKPPLSTHPGQIKDLSWVVGLEPMTLCSLGRVLSTS